MNNSLIHIASRILNIPLLITPTKLDVIVNVLGSRIGINADSEIIAAQAIVKPILNSNSSIAVIPIHGTLVHRTQGFLSASSGFRSYESIRSDFGDALSNPDISDILFDIDSYGGEAAGLLDLVEEIYQARASKSIYAFVNESAYSAAYGIASAADEIFIPRTGGVGSIGVVALHVDQSAYDEKEGLSYTPIFAGAHKIDFSSHQPLSDRGRESLQVEVNQMYEVFTSDVARNRNELSQSQIRATEANIYSGQNALRIGLVDHIMSWNEAIKYIESTRNGGKSMNDKQAKEKIQAILATENIDAKAVMLDSGYVHKDAEPLFNIEQLKMEQSAETEKIREKLSNDHDAAMARIKEITDMCLLAGMPGMISGFLDDNLSSEEIRKSVMDAKAGASQEIISTVSPISTGDLNPVIENAKMRAEAARKGV